ncbi:hypothetical protein Vafri_6782 [Volvox africanus]|uniref:ApaG domain-containing protein n=1 Tax=Volvox africanus TaxID=51714 RepID=A0A8J4EYI3_9CHLO|nr:hypothetical protein Vafri_6782 [Volvox africanus]
MTKALFQLFPMAADPFPGSIPHAQPQDVPAYMSTAQQHKKNCRFPYAITFDSTLFRSMRSAMETVAGLPELTPQCLEHIISHLEPRDALRVACAQKLWHGLVVNDEQLWKRHLVEELGISDKQGVDGSIRRSSWDAYANWRQAFGAEYWPYLGRAVKAWSQIKAWLAANMPEILATLRPGLSEAEVVQVEAEMGLTLPPALKVLHRLHDGQELYSDAALERRIRNKLVLRETGRGNVRMELEPEANVGPEAMARSIFCGLFGGYAVYDRRVVARMLPLRRAALWRIEMLRKLTQPLQRLSDGQDRLLPIACSYNLYDKVLMADMDSGGLSVARLEPGQLELWDAVPRADTRDGPLRWFEEYGRRLASGWYEAGVLDNQYSMLSRGISLFPMRPPGLVEAVTMGVQVRASVVFVPEYKVQDGHMFAYSIRFSLLEGWPLKRCQLMRRHWIIKPEPGRVETVQGEGVVGLFPILEPDRPEFVYCSCTRQTPTRGSMEGRFLFIPGSVERPEGPPFDVICPTFRLDVPDYIF